jgi:hypothetical protein
MRFAAPARRGRPLSRRGAVQCGRRLIVAGETDDWHAGIEEAAEAIDKGLAKACSIAGSPRSPDRTRHVMTDKLAEICATKREEVAIRKANDEPCRT